MGAVTTESGSNAGALPAINPDTDNTVLLSISSTTARTVAALSTTQSNLYRFISTVDCFLNFGNSSIASTTSKMPISANVDYYFVVDTGVYVSAITSGASGSLAITPAKKVA